MGVMENGLWQLLMSFSSQASLYLLPLADQ